MSTEFAEATPAAESGEMSAAERAYFTSRGEDTTGLSAEMPAQKTPVQTSGNTSARNGAGQEYENSDLGTDAATDDGSVDGEIEVDEDGRPRDPKSGRFVPKSAYLRVKEEKSKLASHVAELTSYALRAREREAVMKEMYATGGGTQNQPQETVANPPDPTEDIFGYVKWQAAQIEELKSKLNTTSEETRAAFEQQQLQKSAVADFNAFASREPAFVDAYQFLMGQRHAEMEALGIGDAAQREAIIQQEARNLVTEALRKRASPAESIFKLAKARGFAPKAQQQTGNPLDPKAVEDIERINRGQAAAMSLRGAGQTSGAGQPLTAQALLNMGEKEFSQARSQYIAKHGREGWRKLMGG